MALCLSMAVPSLAGTKSTHQLQAPNDFPLVYSLLMDASILLAFLCTRVFGEDQKATGMVPLFRGESSEGEMEAGEPRI